MATIYVKSVELRNIHKRYDLDISFNESLSVLHGKNGTGKSTLLHIIANVANCDFLRFSFIEFDSIKVDYSDGSSIRIVQEKVDGDTEIQVWTNYGTYFVFSKNNAIEAVRERESEKVFNKYSPQPLIKKVRDFVDSNKLRTVDISYFPAFRTMLEVWSSQREASELSYRRAVRNRLPTRQITSFSRDLFGPFLPVINFPSPLDIEQNLKDEIKEAQINIGRFESSIFSDSFVKVFAALLEGPAKNYNSETLLSEIQELTDSTESTRLGALEGNFEAYKNLQTLFERSSQAGTLVGTTAGALAVYRDALKERRWFQKKAFEEIETYFKVVNSFLEGKELSYELSEGKRGIKVGLKFPDDTWSSIKVMSSGERQLLTMLYAVNKMSGSTSVLIDEPEISLHIDWQEELLGKMMDQLGDRQIIVCTHSPSIAGDYGDYMKEVVPIFNEGNKKIDDNYIEDDYGSLI
ncbi:AAA family ATPase [Halomonas sp. MG34]|nr:AAA family ATPase [Halomonas sp. MG34]